MILGANVSFLTIQSVDAAAVDAVKSNAQRASYVSVLISMGSILSSLLLLRQFRHKNNVSDFFFDPESLNSLTLSTVAILCKSILESLGTGVCGDHVQFAIRPLSVVVRLGLFPYSIAQPLADIVIVC